jgi:hypothetical protein
LESYTPQRLQTFEQLATCVAGRRRFDQVVGSENTRSGFDVSCLDLEVDDAKDAEDFDGGRSPRDAAGRWLLGTVDGNIKAQNFGNVMTDCFNKIKTTSAAVATHVVFSAL